MLTSTCIADIHAEAEALLLAHLADIQGPDVKYTRADARNESMRLVQHICGYSAALQHAFPERHLDEMQLGLLDQLLSRRCLGEPLAYIIGQQGFYDSVFLVSPCTLIPRPETEMLVDLALQKSQSLTNPEVLDLGTGTGAIGLSIALAAPDSYVTCVDFIPDAVQLARQNQQRLRVKNATILQSDWFSEVSGKFDIIVSNPPYVEPDSPYLSKGDLRFEPNTALASSENGLADIKQIVTDASEYLKPQGYLLLEHGFGQASDVQSILAAGNFTEIETLCDYANQPRITLGRIS